MISLLIETSTERGIIALFHDENLLHLVELPVGYQNSKYLLPKIHEIFQKAELKPQDIKLIVVGIGPGSYTGIRVGAITAKALAYALKIPLIGISSLEGFLAEGKYAAIIDAKIGGVYVKIGASEPTLYSLDQAIEQLKSVDILVTPYAQQLQTKMAGSWKWIECYPNHEHLMNLAYAKFKAGDYSSDGRLDLLYLRKTQAEIEKEAKQTQNRWASI